MYMVLQKEPPVHPEGGPDQENAGNKKQTFKYILHVETFYVFLQYFRVSEVVLKSEKVCYGYLWKEIWQHMPTAAI